MASSSSCPRIRFSQLTPELFHDKYIRPRQACVIEDGMELLGPEFASPWRPERLRDMCGDAIVEVESRAIGQQFGQKDVSDRESMPLSQFVELLSTQRYYMTTQKLAEDAEGGQIELGGALAMALVKRMPSVKPAIMGHLVPSQYNVWCGHAAKASRTPLHHDFHDNLYCLLSGRKEFRIFPPRTKIATGAKQHVFPNGLIAYGSDKKYMREDGAPIPAVTAWKQAQLEEEISRLETAVEASSESTERCRLQELLETAEQELDRILDDLLGQEMTRRKPGQVQSGPLHFAQKSATEIGTPTIVKMKPGDVLYLPASTFHEVHSESGDDVFHLAVNMWFHPPRSNAPFEKPYEDDFWLHRFQRILKNSVVNETDKQTPEDKENSCIAKPSKKPRLV